MLAGACGAFRLLSVFFKWARDGGNLDEYPLNDLVDDSSFGGILIQAPDKVVFFEDKYVESMLIKPPFAMGSGAQFSMGAMRAGATAEESVQYACELDPYTGGEVVKFSIFD